MPGVKEGHLYRKRTVRRMNGEIIDMVDEADGGVIIAKGRVVNQDKIDGFHLIKDFKFKNFIESQNFVNKVGEIAEIEGHHPEMWFGWGYAKIKIFTHAIKGLAESDFILAAKIDKISSV